jgi:uncharacterized membrane protein YkvA (DUF1232 family)
MTPGRVAVGGAVPRPPRGRPPRLGGGSARQRVEARQAAERAASALSRTRSMLVLSRDVILLLKDLAADPRVPRGRRFTPAGIALAYLASPIDLVPDWIPVLGQLDDLLVVGWAARRLLSAAGYDVIYDLWRGSDEGLATILALSGVQD